MRRILELPEYAEVQGIGVFGYGKESLEPRIDLDPEKICRGAWKEAKNA